MPKKKNIIILIVVLVVLIIAYFALFRGSSKEPGLTSSSSSPFIPGVDTKSSPEQELAITQEFLSTLLNVKSIKLDDSIFSDPAFATLRDSSIILVPDGNEGRANPFAPIGSDNLGASASSINSSPTSSTAPKTPAN